MRYRYALLCLAVALAPVSAMAGPITYSFSSGVFSATAKFEASGSNLIVTLTNTSTDDVIVPTDVLTAVYFEVTGNPTLTRISAVVPLVSAVYNIGTGADVTPGDRVVGGEWSYLNSINPDPPANAGVSSVGLGVFGAGDRFPGANLQGPTNPDGLQYGITSAGDNLLTGNGGVTGTHLIKNSVLFTLGGWSGEPSALITAASFQYGTDLSEPQFSGTPEPGSIVLAACGATAALAWGFARRRRRS